MFKYTKDLTLNIDIQDIEIWNDYLKQEDELYIFKESNKNHSFSRFVKSVSWDIINMNTITFTLTTTKRLAFYEESILETWIDEQIDSGTIESFINMYSYGYDDKFLETIITCKSTGKLIVKVI